ncbi:MAG TPA: hypothetical protein VK864_05545 [Longimicrobiales bacterium]|nr:hypothetical protein [Longimicrobiales bacterium]
MRIARVAAFALGLALAGCGGAAEEETPPVEETMPPAPAPAPDTTAAMDTTMRMDTTTTTGM